jgi:hypothetical protein
MIDKSKYTAKEIKRMIDSTKHELIVAERDLDELVGTGEYADHVIYIKALWDLLTELRGNNKRLITN